MGKSPNSYHTTITYESAAHEVEIMMVGKKII